MCFRIGRSAFLAVLVIVGASAAASARASECVNLPSSNLHLYSIESESFGADRCYGTSPEGGPSQRLSVSGSDRMNAWMEAIWLFSEMNAKSVALT